MRDIYFSVVKEAEECTYTTTFVDCVVQLTAKAFATAESLYPSSSTIATNEAWPCILNLFLSLEGCQASPTRAGKNSELWNGIAGSSSQGGWRKTVLLPSTAHRQPS